jgi:PPP family 3-phenylpropionic acid transporter
MKKTSAQYAALYNFSYMAIGALTRLIGQYLKYIGFTGAQIGTVTAAGTAMAIFAATFWGGVYNSAASKHRIIIILCIMASIVCFTLSGIERYGIFIILFGIMYFFQAPIMSLTDAFVVQRAQHFGSLRAWGAVGFASGVFLAGIASDNFGIRTFFWIYILSFIIAAGMVYLTGHAKGASYTEPDCAGGENDELKYEKKRKKSGYLDVLKNRKLRNLIICAFFMGGTNVANNTYFSFLYIEGGGTVACVGIAMLLMVGSEVPFMAWCEKLAARFTMEKIILAAMIISVIRFFIYGAGLPWWGLIIVSFSQGAVNGILLIEFVRYVYKLAPKGSESLAISAYYVISSNLSTVLCQTLGGIILDAAGASGVYVFFCLYNFIGVLMYCKYRLYKTAEEVE